MENNNKASGVTYLFMSDKEHKASLKRILKELQTWCRKDSQLKKISMVIETTYPHFRKKTVS